jgi:hypothetical protein
MDFEPAPAGGAPAPDGASDYLAEVARLGRFLRGAAVAESEDDALARITALEELTATIAAAQSAEAVAFAELRRDRDRLNGLPVQEWGVRAGDEVGLAKRVSPGSGRKFLTAAQALVTELPGTYAALAAGEISADRARIVVEETATLDPGDRGRGCGRASASRDRAVCAPRCGHWRCRSTPRMPRRRRSVPPLTGGCR